MQLEAQLGADDQTQLHRARGMTEEIKEDTPWREARLTKSAGKIFEEI